MLKLTRGFLEKIQNIPYRVIFSALPQKKKLISLRILSQLIELFLPVLFGMLISLLTQGSSYKDINIFVCGVILLSLMEILFSWKNESCAITSFYKQEQNLKEILWKHLEVMSLRDRDAIPAGFWMQKFSRDIVMISGTCRMLLESGLSFIVFFFGTFLLILWKVHDLAFVFGIVVVFATITQQIFYRRLENSTKEMRQCFYHEGNTILNLLEILPVLSLFGVVSLYTSLFTEKVEKTIQSQIRQQKFMLQFKSIIQLEFWSIHAVVLPTCTWLFFQKHLEIGDIVMYDMLISQMLSGMSQMIFILPQLISGMEYAQSLKDQLQPSTQEILKSAPCSESIENLIRSDLCMQKGHSVFVLKDVTFHYTVNGPPVINEFSANIQHGDFVCFLGRNGTGKSTLAKLLMGVYPPDNGSIYTNGTSSAIVPQQIVIYPDSLLENIRLRDISIQTKMIEKMLCSCGFERFLQKHVEGMYTMLLPGMLSGGELQILGIVRALVRKPEVLILDELTNNLDIVAKEAVYSVLKSISDKCTIILITHDISCLELANRIFVFHSEGICEVRGRDAEKKIKEAIQLIRRDVRI